MSSQLPLLIERYVAAANSGDVDSLPDLFASSATVRDEGGTHAGLDAIRKWMAGTQEKYGYSMLALGSREQAGKTVVDVRLTGSFPGSRVTLEFIFAITEGRIESLEIRS